MPASAKRRSPTWSTASSPRSRSRPGSEADGGGGVEAAAAGDEDRRRAARRLAGARQPHRQRRVALGRVGGRVDGGALDRLPPRVPDGLRGGGHHGGPPGG